MKGILLLGILPAVLSSCALHSPYKFYTDEKYINIRAIDDKNDDEISNANCMVCAADNVSYQLRTNPGIVKLHKAYTRFNINCEAKDYEQVSVKSSYRFKEKPSTNAGLVFDVFFGNAKDHGRSDMHNYFTVYMKKSDQ